MYEYEVRIDFLNCNRWTRTIRDAPYVLLRFALLLKTQITPYKNIAITMAAKKDLKETIPKLSVPGTHTHTHTHTHDVQY